MQNYYPLSLIFVQEKETTNQSDFTDVFNAPAAGRILALDLGTKRIGVAVSDELQITVRAVAVIKRTGWKKLLKQIISYLEEFDAVALVLGLPFEFEGGESEMSQEARRLARNFSLSLKIPVYLQDERLSTYEARGNLWKQGANEKKIRQTLDAEAAAIILQDFIDRKSQKPVIEG
ncbi:Holliday junction resolvase RuvX [soil metagenome]